MREEYIDGWIACALLSVARRHVQCSHCCSVEHGGSATQSSAAAAPRPTSLVILLMTYLFHQIRAICSINRRVASPVELEHIGRAGRGRAAAGGAHLRSHRGPRAAIVPNITPFPECPLSRLPLFILSLVNVKITLGTWFDNSIRPLIRFRS